MEEDGDDGRLFFVFKAVSSLEGAGGNGWVTFCCNIISNCALVWEECKIPLKG